MREYFKELDTPIYQLRIEMTENDGGGSVWIGIQTANGTRLHVTDLFMQMGTVASARSSQIEIRDSSGNMFKRFASSSLNSNEFFSMGLGSDGVSNKTPLHPFTIANGDKIIFRASNLANNETYQVYVRGYIRGRLPTTSTAGSSNTPATNTIYARII